MKRILLFILLVCNISVNAQMNSKIYYHKGKAYSKNCYISPYRISSFELESMLYDKSPFLCDQYKEGIALKTTGAVFLGVGIPATIASIILLPITYANRYYYRGYYYYDKHMYNAGWSMFGIGVGLTSVGIPLYSVGLNKIKNSIQSYNRNEVKLTFLLKDNGIGLALNL